MGQPPDGFAEFVEARSAALVRTAWMLTGDRSMAEDVVQTALAKTWARWSAIEPVSAAREAYVRRVLVRTYIGWRRRPWAALTRLGELPETGSPSDEISDWDLRDALLQELRRLPPRQQAVIVLRYFTDLSEASTAEVLGCSVGTVKTHASRGLRTLKNSLDRDVSRIEGST